MAALQLYARLRDQLQPRPQEPSFFVSLTRKRLLYAVVGVVGRAGPSMLDMIFSLWLGSAVR
jgi:hypothetical protein